MMKTDILIVGCGVGGLYCALNLPTDKKITVITKAGLEESDSFLAQGGICVQRDGEDYESFFEDTLKAGHYENSKESVDIMIRSSRAVIDDLISYGVRFERDENGLVYTKEGAHSKPRILFHADQTGREITSSLLRAAKKRPNITLIEHFTMVDIITDGSSCFGIVAKDENGQFSEITADVTVLATGGVGGLFAHSTNFPHLTGDGLAVCLKHGIKLRDADYIQIHPTTLYTKKSGRRFLISESVRGEGAELLDADGRRFVNELLPRDLVTKAIYARMKEDGTDHVMLSLAPLSEDEVKKHFPNIYKRCLEEGYDVTKESIPVVPAQHYYMGGIAVDMHSRTSMERLYAVGETACNGVHGKNRLASNSLLESLVFAKRAAGDMVKYPPVKETYEADTDPAHYKGYEEEYRQAVLAAIGKGE